MEECKYRVKKIQISRFINTELKSDSESSDSELDSEEEWKFDNKLMAKLESGPYFQCLCFNISNWKTL